VISGGTWARTLNDKAVLEALHEVVAFAKYSVIIYYGYLKLKMPMQSILNY